MHAGTKPMHLNRTKAAALAVVPGRWGGAYSLTALNHQTNGKTKNLHRSRALTRPRRNQSASYSSMTKCRFRGEKGFPLRSGDYTHPMTMPSRLTKVGMRLNASFHAWMYAHASIHPSGWGKSKYRSTGLLFIHTWMEARLTLGIK